MLIYNQNKEGGIENGIKKYGKLEKVKNINLQEDKGI